MNDLNIICARAIIEEMEYGLFDGTDMAIDVVSGKFDDDEDYDDKEDDEGREVLHGQDY